MVILDARLHVTVGVGKVVLSIYPIMPRFSEEILIRSRPEQFVLAKLQLSLVRIFKSLLRSRACHGNAKQYVPEYPRGILFWDLACVCACDARCNEDPVWLYGLYGQSRLSRFRFFFVSLLPRLALGLPCIFLAKAEFEAAASCSIRHDCGLAGSNILCNRCPQAKPGGGCAKYINPMLVRYYYYFRTRHLPVISSRTLNAKIPERARQMPKAIKKLRTNAIQTGGVDDPLNVVSIRTRGEGTDGLEAKEVYEQVDQAPSSNCTRNLPSLPSLPFGIETRFESASEWHRARQRKVVR